MGGPNACNLCHVDRPISWTVKELNNRWGLKIRPDQNWSAEYGENLERPLGEVWMNHSRALMRLVATDAVQNSPFTESPIPKLLTILKDRYAVNRMFGLFAVEELIGRSLTIDEYDPLARQTDLGKSVENLIQQFSTEQPAARTDGTDSEPDN